MQIFDCAKTILSVIISPWGCTGFPENSMSFPCSEKPWSIPGFSGLWPPWISVFSPLVPEENLWYKWQRFFSSHQTGSVKALQLSSLLQISGVPHPFFIQDWTSDRRGVVPFTLALWSQYHHHPYSPKRRNKHSTQSTQGTSTSSTITGRWVRKDTCPSMLCDSSRCNMELASSPRSPTTPP